MSLQTMPRFVRVIDELIDGLQSGQIVVKPSPFSADALNLIADAMESALRDTTQLLATSELRGAALCSCLWDCVLSHVQQAIGRRWPTGEYFLSYWLAQSELMVGYYSQDVRDSEHIGHLYSNKLPYEESPCGRTLISALPAFYSDVHALFESSELSKAIECVGSLATWPVFGRGPTQDPEMGLAVLLLEARTSGAIEDCPETRLFLSNVAELFSLLYQFTVRDTDAANLPNAISSMESPASGTSIQSQLTNSK